MNYAVMLLGQGKYAEAEKYLKRAMQLTPDYSYVYTNMGVLKEKTGDFTAAEDYFLRGITLGSYAGHYFLYGQFLYRRARFLEAQVLFQKSIQLSNSYLAPHELLMKTYAFLGEWDLLKNVSAETLKISAGNENALTGLKESLARKTSAEIQADKAHVNPTAEKYVDLSLAYFNEGKYGLSIESAKKALELKPNYVEAYNNIGCSYNILVQFDQSVEAFKKALAIKPDYQLAKNNLALSQAHRFISDELISAQVYTAADYVNQSLTFYNQGQYELCIAACISALVINPDYDLAYNNLCAAYTRLGQWDDAITVGEKGLKINPTNQLLKNNLAQAELFKKNGRK
jgi:tetratricopeptide (TPR) repeat protein